MEYTHKEFANVLRSGLYGGYMLVAASAWLEEFSGCIGERPSSMSVVMQTLILLAADALEAGDIDPPDYAVTLAIGDVVLLDKERTKSVVTGCKMSEDGSVKYTVSGCGVYSRNRLRLVQRADYASLEYAMFLEYED